MHLITSTLPSVKIENMGGKVCLRCEGKTLLGVVNKLLKIKSYRQCFPFTPQANFPAHILNFHWRCWWWDQMQAIFINLFYFNWKNILDGIQFKSSLFCYQVVERLGKVQKIIARRQEKLICLFFQLLNWPKDD